MFIQGGGSFTEEHIVFIVNAIFVQVNSNLKACVYNDVVVTCGKLEIMASLY